MLKPCLLDRIREAERQGNLPQGDDIRLLMRSVLNNLQRILNTRRGNVETLPEFGIPDFTEIVHTMPESIIQFQQAIRQTIRRYEPRLEHVRVKYMPVEDDPLAIHFELMAHLPVGRKRHPVTIHTEVTSEGMVKVKE